MDSGMFGDEWGTGESLYLAWSVAGTFRGADNVLLSWFASGRQGPSAQARFLVKGYDEAGDVRQRILDRYVAELFTGREVELLREHLWKTRGLALSTLRVAHPIDSRVNPTGVVPISFGINMFVLPRTRKNPLPFDVWAYYDLSSQWRGHMESGDLLRGPRARETADNRITQ